MIYTTKELFDKIPEKCAIGAFNVHNMEYTQAVIRAAEAEQAPVILMIGEPMIPYAGLDMLAEICKEAAGAARIPVAIALDHGKIKENIDRCIQLGICVMVDGSHLSFEKNVAFTRDVVERAHARGLSVEGEIGSIGGSEDGEAQLEKMMTDPDAAAEFAEKSGVDILAVSIGNVHGLYHGECHIDINRLKEIANRVHVPIVMHGGSDLEQGISKEAIQNGIRKFNIGTDLKYAFSTTLRATLNQTPMPFQPHAVLGPARDAVEQVAREKIRLFGTSGMAGCFR
jgi:ketose-bisphosphate aldolase